MGKGKLLALALAAALLAGCGVAPGTSSGSGAASSGGASSSASGSSSASSSDQEQNVPTGPNVWTDWSKLEQSPSRIVRKEVYRRATAKYVDHLVPRSDYGTLIPYAGAVAVSTDWWGGRVYLYGLMTLDGTVVVDPVYTDVFIPVTRYDRQGNPQEQSAVMILEQVVKTQGNLWDGTLVGVAALDGSWCTQVAYLACLCKGDELVLYASDRVERWSTQGELLDQWIWAELGIDGQTVGQAAAGDNLMFWSQPPWWGDFVWLGWGDEGYRVINLSTGAVEEYTHELLDEMYPQPESLDNEGWTYSWQGESTRLTRGEEEHLIPCQMPYVFVRGGLVFLSETDGTETVYTLGGKELAPKGRYWYLQPMYDQWHQDQPATLLRVRGLDGKNQLLDFEGKQAAPWEDGAEAALREGIWEQRCADGWVTYHRLDTGECIMSRMIGLVE